MCHANLYELRRLGQIVGVLRQYLTFFIKPRSFSLDGRDILEGLLHHTHISYLFFGYDQIDHYIACLDSGCLPPKISQVASAYSIWNISDHILNRFFEATKALSDIQNPSMVGHLPLVR
jgi:hypothetical protein